MARPSATDAAATRVASSRGIVTRISRPLVPDPAGPSSAGSTASTRGVRRQHHRLPGRLVAADHVDPAARAEQARDPGVGQPHRHRGRARARPPGRRPGQPDVGDRLAGPGRAGQHLPLGGGRLGQRPGRAPARAASTGRRGRPRRTVAPAARSVAATRTGTALRAARWARGRAPGPPWPAGRPPAGAAAPSGASPAPARPTPRGRAAGERGGPGSSTERRSGTPDRRRGIAAPAGLWTTRGPGGQLRRGLADAPRSGPSPARAGRPRLRTPRRAGGAGRSSDVECWSSWMPLSVPAFAVPVLAGRRRSRWSPPPSLLAAPFLAGASPPVTVLPEPERLSVR